MPSKFKLELGKYGRENVAPVFSTFTPKTLGITRKEYNRYKSIVDNGGDLPVKIQKKIISKTDIQDRVSVKLFKNTPIKITVPKQISATMKKQKRILVPVIEINKKGKREVVSFKKRDPKNIWVKFSLYKDQPFMKSAILPLSKIKQLSSFINDYIDVHIKQYKETEAIYITDITIQLV